MRYLGLISVFVTSAAFSAIKTYDLKLELARNGQKVTSSHVVVKEGETTTIIEKMGGEERFIEVTPEKSSTFGIEGIKMKVAVGTIGPKGERTVLANPEVIVEESKKAQLTIGEMEEQDELSFSALLIEKPAP
jgi:hypothetical protein